MGTPSGSQRVPTLASPTIDIDAFLGAQGDGRYRIRPETHGAFGGAFGGLLAAIVLRAARATAPGRQPISLDVAFLRGVAAGDVQVDAEVRHAGRSLTAVDVAIRAGDKLTTTATVKLADQSVLADVDVPGLAASRPPAPPYSAGREWGANAEAIPMVGTLKPRTITGDDPRGIGLALEVPWDSTGADAEAAAFVADAAVGPPVGFVAGGRFAHPNPDLSLRFVPGATVGCEVVGFGRAERGGGGSVLVSLEVWSGAALVAVGVSCSLQLPLP